MIKVQWLFILVILGIGFTSCRQRVCYYELPEDYFKTYRIYVGQEGKEPLRKDSNGNFLIKLDTAIYTSTKYEDLNNTVGYFSISNKTGFLSEAAIEQEYNLKITHPAAGYKISSDGKNLNPYYLHITISPAGSKSRL